MAEFFKKETLWQVNSHIERGDQGQEGKELVAVYAAIILISAICAILSGASGICIWRYSSGINLSLFAVLTLSCVILQTWLAFYFSHMTFQAKDSIDSFCNSKSLSDRFGSA